MIGDWLIIGIVVVSLWGFWWWLGALFDAISEYHAATRREDAQARKGKGS